MKSRTSRMWIFTVFGLSVLMIWMGSRANGLDTGMVGGLILIIPLVLGFSCPKLAIFASPPLSKPITKTQPPTASNPARGREAESLREEIEKLHAAGK
jgi:hypothetical protein